MANSTRSPRALAFPSKSRQKVASSLKAASRFSRACASCGLSHRSGVAERASSFVTSVSLEATSKTLCQEGDALLDTLDLTLKLLHSNSVLL